MPKAIRAATMVTLALLLFWMDGNAASRLLYENFDDGVLDSRITVFGNSWNVLSPPQYTLGEAGRSGSGHSFTSGTIDAAYLCWKTNVPNPWPTDEFYVSFWMRYPKFVITNSTNENLKIFYPHWDGVDSYVHYALAQPNLVYYSAKAKGAMVAQSRWITCTGMTDGKWHHYEFYVKFSRGISKFVYDGATKVDDAYGTGKWTNKMYYLSMPSVNGRSVPSDPNPGDFTRQLDDLEIWDGTPGTPQQTASPLPPYGIKARVTG